jgi:hypothetical protein
MNQKSIVKKWLLRTSSCLLLSVGIPLSVQSSVEFTLEAWEDWGSCPWVAPWTGSEFELDNDIYPTARYAPGEFRDYYRLTKPLIAKNSVYPFEIQEVDKETSYTDFVSLILVDHTSDVAVAPDKAGNLTAYKPAELIAPTSAISHDGKNVLDLISLSDNQGFPALSQDTVTLTFNHSNLPQGAVLVLRVVGFIPGDGESRPFTEPPAVVVETKDVNGSWLERGRLSPRNNYSETAFNLTPYLGGGNVLEVRLRSISHDFMSNVIDYAALYAGVIPSFETTTLLPQVATFKNQNFLTTVLTADNNYLQMSTGEKFYTEFSEQPLAPGKVREFIFVTEGYYIPNNLGTFYVLVWDGIDWQFTGQAYTYPVSEDYYTFNLDGYLPDTNGEYKIRLYQDGGWGWGSAGIDWTGMTIDGVESTLTSAWDIWYGDDILSFLQYSDDNRFNWWGDMMIELHFNRPPVCSAATASVATLWPPNHQWANVGILNVTDPEGGVVTINIASITSDEPTASDLGSGGAQHAPDAQGINTPTAQLRVERSGQGNGRVYGINFSAADPQGATCSGYVTVCVPPNQGKSSSCVDSGQNYDATGLN